ncbi:hypothetical protein [Undibacterium sp. TJN19]|uniref:hypothetical protein n=1 Tax=Undibacterium sp. TJN19 TaxID=3413055 RepID=UPI003BF376B4
MNNDAPDNGDFAAYLKNLDKSNKSNPSSNPVVYTTLPAFQNAGVEDVTNEERLRIQELAELPPISEDDLLLQALATKGDSNDHALAERIDDNANDRNGGAGSTQQNEPASEPLSEQTPLGFLGEHALELADQPTPEELGEMPPITDEELLQQALTHPDADEDISSE